MEKPTDAAHTTVTLQAESIQEPERLDVFLTNQYPGHSRTFYKKLIESGAVVLNNTPATKASLLVKAGDTVMVTFTPQQPKNIPAACADMGIKNVYEHEHFLIIYKPAHVLVHPPTHTSTTPTLIDWLLCHYSHLRYIGQTERPAIVHRLDKDTSGILIIPKTPYAYIYFSNLFKDRCIDKNYLAVVTGHPAPQGSIDFPIARHPVHKHKMTHTQAHGRTALTYYSVLEYFPHAALLSVSPVTGRTHQIRVHCAAIGHPIIGDSTYGSASPLITRQALHAYRLSFTFDGQPYTFWYDMPADMRSLIELLRQQKA